MIVVSDTSPLTALLTVGEQDLLPRLFREVVIPEAVRNQLLRCHPQLPDWLRVASPRNLAQVGQYSQLVDAGEAEAIELAKELHADRLLIDERKGRRLALREGVQVIGLLGVVLLAKRKALIPSARTLLTRLDQDANGAAPSDAGGWPHPTDRAGCHLVFFFPVPIRPLSQLFLHPARRGPHHSLPQRHHSSDRQSFLFTCEPTSHTRLSGWVEGLSASARPTRAIGSSGL